MVGPEAVTELLPFDTARRRARLSAADFELLDRHGAFAAYRKAELIDGDVFYVNAQHRPHAMTKMRLYDALRQALRAAGSRYVPVCEATLALSSYDRPEPDILLTNDPDGDGFVPVASVPLVVEVADTTLDDDLGRKLRRYAAGGVPEYWVADVNARVIHQMWAPAEDGYSRRQTVAFGQPLGVVTTSLLVETAEL
jgi:Uma2 family endonuclease